MSPAPTRSVEASISDCGAWSTPTRLQTTTPSPPACVTVSGWRPFASTDVRLQGELTFDDRQRMAANRGATPGVQDLNVHAPVAAELGPLRHDVLATDRLEEPAPGEVGRQR